MPSIEANKETYKKESKSKKKESKSKKKTSKTSKSGGGDGPIATIASAGGSEEEAGESVFGKTDAMCMSMAGMSMSM